jgi:hypothetical protein
MVIEFFLQLAQNTKKRVAGRIPPIARIGSPLWVQIESFNAPIDTGIETPGPKAADNRPRLRHVQSSGCCIAELQ